MKRLVSLGVVLLVVLALISVLGVAGKLESWKVVQGGHGGLALKITNTESGPLNYIEIYYWYGAGNFEVGSCIGFNSTAVKSIKNYKIGQTHWYGAKSVIEFEGKGVQPGGTLYCTLSKAGATPGELEDLRKNAHEKLIHHIYGTQKR